MKPVLFYAKCRPQECDAWEIAKRARRVFIGYPPFRDGFSENMVLPWREKGIHEFIVDIADTALAAQGKVGRPRGYSQQVSSNQSLARQIHKGSIVLVPRPQHGLCYAGTIAGSFELVDRPSWGDEYLALRSTQGHPLSPEMSHVGDVVQTWPVEEWRCITFPALPRWISYRLLSRNTIGIIHDLTDPDVCAIDVVSEIMGLAFRNQYSWLASQKGAASALLSWLSPELLEHVAVDLLNLEAQAGISWHHVGGSGDGGVDGIAVDRLGALTAVVQCKWSLTGSPDRLAESIRAAVPGGTDIYIVILQGAENWKPPSDGVTFWNRSAIARLMQNHADKLPAARALGFPG